MEADGMALWHAAASGNLEEVDRLTKGGVDSNVRNAEQNDSTPLHVASSRGHLEVVRYLVEDAEADKDSQDADDETPIMWALIEDKHAVVEYLLSSGADVSKVDSNGMTALHRAIMETANNRILTALISAGADVNARDADRSMTPLHRAVEEVELDLVHMLLQSSADVTVRDDTGSTPLHLAVHAKDDRIVELLVEAVARDRACSDLNMRDQNGWVPLHHAARICSLSTVRLLVEAGADYSARTPSLSGDNTEGGGDAGGRTAEDIAEEEGRLEIAQFLRETRAFRLLPVAMGWHPRLGADSPLILLDPGLLRVIATFPIT